MQNVFIVSSFLLYFFFVFRSIRFFNNICMKYKCDFLFISQIISMNQTLKMFVIIFIAVADAIRCNGYSSIYFIELLSVFNYVYKTFSFVLRFKLCHLIPHSSLLWNNSTRLCGRKRRKI